MPPLVVSPGSPHARTRAHGGISRHAPTAPHTWLVHVPGGPDQYLAAVAELAFGVFQGVSGSPLDLPFSAPGAPRPCSTTNLGPGLRAQQRPADYGPSAAILETRRLLGPASRGGAAWKRQRGRARRLAQRSPPPSTPSGRQMPGPARLGVQALSGHYGLPPFSAIAMSLSVDSPKLRDGIKPGKSLPAFIQIRR